MSKAHSTNTIMKYFKYAHLPLPLRVVSSEICEVAESMELLLPNSPEKSAGLRKLLEAKDCFVRASIEDNNNA